MLTHNPAKNPGTLFAAVTGNFAERQVPQSRATAQPIALLGVVFDNVTLRETVARIEAMIASGRPHYIATANVDFLVQAQRDLELRHILLAAPLVLCDGTPLVWASRFLGNPLPERVAGADVMPELIRVAAKKNYRMFFLGTTEEANQQAVARLRAEFPNLEIGHYSPPFRSLLEMDDDEIIRRIREFKPELLFVAFGCPKAEKWIAMHHRELGVPVSIGVGATIDFLAGRMKRAPVWMQRVGMEWLFRLGQEPRRLFKRYASDLWYFGGAILRQLWKLKWRSGANRASARSCILQSERTWLRVEAADRFDRESLERDTRFWKKITKGGRHCLLKADAVNSMDSTGVAALVHVQRELRARGCELILLSPSAAVSRALKEMRLEDFFAVATDALEARGVIHARWQERCAVLAGDATTPLAWLGEITATNAEQVWKKTWDAIHAANAVPDSWIIDLAAVRYMDTGGVKLLLRAIELARDCGVRLRFCEPSMAVRNVLRVSGMESLLQPFA